MDPKALAAVFGSSFKCCMCGVTHSRPDLKIRSVWKCFDSLLGGRRATIYYQPQFFLTKILFEKEFREFHAFNLRNYVYLLSLPREKAVEQLENSIEEWRSNLRKKELALYESDDMEVPKFEVVLGKIYFPHTGLSVNFSEAILFMKDEVASSLASTFGSQIGSEYKCIDLEWKRVKDPAKALFAHKERRNEGRILIDAVRKVTWIPAPVRSVAEAELYLKEKGPTTPAGGFPQVDAVRAQ